METNQIGHDGLVAAEDAVPAGPSAENNNLNPGVIQLSARSAADIVVQESYGAAETNQPANDNPPLVSYHDRLRQQAHAPVGVNESNHSNGFSSSSSSSSMAGNRSSRVDNHGNGDSSNNRITFPLPLPNVRSFPHLEDLNLAGNAGPRFINRGPPEAEIDHDIMSSSHGSPHAAVSGWSLVTENNGGAPPPTRSLHAAAVLNKVMYVFGGYDGVTRVNTFHAYSFAEKRWSPVHAVGGPPGPRDRHVAFSFGFKFFVHGGFNGTSRVSDFWGFDLSSMTWREVVVLGGRPPSPRHSHSAVVHRQSLYIYGGYDGSYSTCLARLLRRVLWHLVPADSVILLLSSLFVATQNPTCTNLILQRLNGLLFQRPVGALARDIVLPQSSIKT